MKKNKFLASIILTASLMGLTGCGLFNDSDIAIKNSYNVPAETPEEDPDAIKINDVAATEIEQVPEAYCFKNISYATDDYVANTYKDKSFKYEVNGNQNYSANRTSNNYDLYVPYSAPKDKDHVVILFIHGGAWVSGFKTDVNPYVFDFANRGYITATIKYTLLSKQMDNPSLSIFRNLDEINACIKSIKASLQSLGFDTSKSHLVIGGASSGAHLSMLYSYSRGSDSAMPIEFIVNAVGPVDIKPDNWKCFKDNVEASVAAGITYNAIKDQADADNLSPLHIAGEPADTKWNAYQTMRIANGMCGLPYPLSVVEAASSDKETISDPSNPAYVSMTEANGGEDLLSVTHFINSTNKIPMVCAYAGRDGTVGIAQFAKLQKAFMDISFTDYDFTYFPDSDHTQISASVDKAHYDEFINNIVTRCAAIQSAE